MNRIPPVHPILFAMFPILHLLATNWEPWPARALLIPMAWIIGSVAILWVLLILLLASPKKAAIMVSISVILFFSYRAFYMGLSIVLGSFLNSTLFAISYLALIVLAIYSVRKISRNLDTCTTLLNAMALFMVLVPSIRIGIHQHKLGKTLKGIAKEQNTLQYNNNASNLPNVYYIILDGYAREDILNELYDYDNSKFISDLRSKGFYIASRSRTNYMQTALSLASSLNGTYLDSLAQQVGYDFPDRAPLSQMIRNNEAARCFKDHGYQIVTLSSGYFAAEFEVTKGDVHIKTGHLGLFVNALIQTTPISDLPFVSMFQHNIHRSSILRTFERISNTTSLKGPSFVFAHILTPHPPFVFKANGGNRQPEGWFSGLDGSHLTNLKEDRRKDYMQYYRDQLAFISKQMMSVVTRLLSDSDRPPIIVIQSDHGPGAMLNWEDVNDSSIPERVSILNAYYLPNGGRDKLYDEITPVNTFKVINNSIWQTNTPLLEDKCFFSTWSKPYRFIDVTSQTNIEASD
ncbi:sulfatase-like hydrolase/transferase [Planctomycetota bacterium]